MKCTNLKKNASVDEKHDYDQKCHRNGKKPKN